jgi:hypothetical protein
MAPRSRPCCGLFSARAVIAGVEPVKAEAPQSPLSSPEPVAESGTRPVDDVAESIGRLEHRAAKARNRVLIVGIMLSFVIFVFAMVSTERASKFVDSNAAFYSRLFVSGVGKRSAADVLEQRVVFLSMGRLPPVQSGKAESDKAPSDGTTTHTYKLVGTGTYDPPPDEYVIPTQDEVERRSRLIAGALKDWERAIQIEQLKPAASAAALTVLPPAQGGAEFSSMIASAVFSLASVAFAVLLIQIAVLFLKYHTRLAELYEAHAQALRASGGDTAYIKRLSEQFSPSTIDVGGTPVTLYEKALDTIRDVAKGGAEKVKARK